MHHPNQHRQQRQQRDRIERTGCQLLEIAPAWDLRLFGEDV